MVDTCAMKVSAVLYHVDMHAYVATAMVAAVLAA